MWEDDFASSIFSMLSLLDDVLSASFELEEEEDDEGGGEEELVSLGADRLEISSPSSAIRAMILPTWIDASFSSYYKEFMRLADARLNGTSSVNSR